MRDVGKSARVARQRAFEERRLARKIGNFDPKKDPWLAMQKNTREYKIQGWKKTSGLDTTGEKQLRLAYFTLSKYRKHHKKELERALVDAGNDKELIKSTLTDYREKIKNATITPKRMIEYLNQKRPKGDTSYWTGYYNKDSKSTVLFRDDKRVGYFLHGKNAFEKLKRQPSGLEREVFVKKWDGLKGDETRKKITKHEYVKDDNGNFTRRFAFRNDTKNFLDQLKKDRLVGKGRHFRERKNVDPGSEPGFNMASISEMDLLGMPKRKKESMKRFKEHLMFLKKEKRVHFRRMAIKDKEELGEHLLTKRHTVSDDRALFLHQYWGNQNSQRGFALTSTPRGIVGNYGEGFGYKRDEQERRKIKIDLARVPKRRKGESPMLINYDSVVHGSHRITAPNRIFSNTEPGKQIRYSGKQFTSSTTKNREVFLKTLKRKFVVDWNVPMKALDVLPGHKH
jgi:hypothetical protein